MALKHSFLSRLLLRHVHGRQGSDDCATATGADSTYGGSDISYQQPDCSLSADLSMVANGPPQNCNNWSSAYVREHSWRGRHIDVPMHGQAVQCSTTKSNSEWSRR